MSSYRLRHPRRDEVAATAKLVIDYETALYGTTTFTKDDLESEWADLDLDSVVWVAEDAAGIVGYASLQDRGELFRGEVYVHPEANVDAVGGGVAALLERTAAERGARRLQASVFEPDDALKRLLEEREYRQVRIFREMRIDLEAPPDPPRLPDGLRFDAFDRDRDARAFYAAQQEAFADHWEHHPRPFEEWSKFHLEGEKFDPALWSLVRAGDEIAAGAISVAGLYGGGFVNVLFTRRPWRGRGVAGALLQDAFARLWSRGERSIGLGVDAEGDTGAFRVYERAGMKPALGWVMLEKELGSWDEQR